MRLAHKCVNARLCTITLLTQKKTINTIPSPESRREEKPNVSKKKKKKWERLGDSSLDLSRACRRSSIVANLPGNGTATRMDCFKYPRVPYGTYHSAPVFIHAIFLSIATILPYHKTVELTLSHYAHTRSHNMWCSHQRNCVRRLWEAQRYCSPFFSHSICSLLQVYQVHAPPDAT